MRKYFQKTVVILSGIFFFQISNASTISISYDFNDNNLPTGWEIYGAQPTLNNGRIEISDGRQVVLALPTQGSISGANKDLTGVRSLTLSYDFGGNSAEWFRLLGGSTAISLDARPSFIGLGFEEGNSSKGYSVSPYPVPRDTVGYHVTATWTSGSFAQVVMTGLSDSRISVVLNKDDGRPINLEAISALYMFSAGQGGWLDNISLSAGTEPHQAIAPFTTTMKFPNINELPRVGQDPTISVTSTGEINIDIPIYFNYSSIEKISQEKEWISGINSKWSAFTATNQYGETYKINFNAHRVNSESESTFTIDVLSGFGADAPPCRKGDSLPPGCNAPHVDKATGHMVMYERFIHYCHNINNEIIPCTKENSNGARDYLRLSMPPRLVDCPLAAGAGTTICLDMEENYPEVAAHEFGHLLGINDEYQDRPSNYKGDYWFPLCYLNDSNLITGCQGGEKIGLMGEIGFPVQVRYINYLLENLDEYTSGLNWVFGYSPTWNDGLPENFDYNFYDTKISTLDIQNSTSFSVDEPLDWSLTVISMIAALAASSGMSSRKKLVSF